MTVALPDVAREFILAVTGRAMTLAKLLLIVTSVFAVRRVLRRQPPQARAAPRQATFEDTAPAAHAVRHPLGEQPGSPGDRKP